tara:strand:+ start:2063 stop:2743 length:681 start_codon:yes stop_codon:yes gene_type:complete
VRIADIIRHISNLFEKKKKNPIQLDNDSNLESNLKFLKVGDKSTPIQMSEDTINVNGNLNVNGSAVQTGIDAGTILGYTCIDDYAVHYLETSFTVEDAGHKVTFTAPPSGNVEIEFTGYFDRTSTSDVTVFAGLSDNSTYNSLGNTYEYDYGGVKSDDEIDDEIITFKWCVSGLVSGTSTTYYLGLKSSDATAVHIKYGYRSSNGLAYQPFTMKATALPETIYDGT